MHSSQYYGSHRNVGTIKRFVHICQMAPKVYNSNFKEQSTCDSNIYIYIYIYISQNRIFSPLCLIKTMHNKKQLITNVS